MKTSSDVNQDHPQYLNDESGLVTDGQADRIFFPQDEAELIQVMKDANATNTPVTISGGGTGISGGRVPLSGWIIATDDMTGVQSAQSVWRDTITGKEFEYTLNEEGETATLTVPVSISVKAIQDLCRSINWFYPPDPTERSCFIGGNVVTNASGARSFKYGPTRSWVEALRVVLPTGDITILDRSDPVIGAAKQVTIPTSSGAITLPRPSYPPAKSSKNVAGIVITDESQPIDFFIGNDGLLGAVTEVTLKLIRPPSSILNIFIYVDSLQQAISLAKVAQKNRSLQSGPVPMSVEYLDDRAIQIISAVEAVPDTARGVVILEQDAASEDDLYEVIEYWMTQFDGLGLEHTSVAQTHKEIEHHKHLRHKIPETINETARNNGQPKLGTDYAAPLDMMEEMCNLAVQLGEEFESQVQKEGDPFAYAIWSHFGDNHVHLNFLPQTDEQQDLAKDLMVRYMQQVVKWEGSIAAEHGLGKKVFAGEPALMLQLRKEGLQQLYDLKKAVDPNMLLNRENLLGRDLSIYE